MMRLLRCKPRTLLVKQQNIDFALESRFLRLTLFLRWKNIYQLVSTKEEGVLVIRIHISFMMTRDLFCKTKLLASESYKCRMIIA